MVFNGEKEMKHKLEHSKKAIVTLVMYWECIMETKTKKEKYE